MVCLQTLRLSYRRSDFGDEEREGVAVRPYHVMCRNPRRRWNPENVVEQEKPNAVEGRAPDWVTSRSQDSPKRRVTTVVGGKIGSAHLPQRWRYQAQALG